jgi:NADH-quinone oxidoreductase subunit A
VGGCGYAARAFSRGTSRSFRFDRTTVRRVGPCWGGAALLAQFVGILLIFVVALLVAGLLGGLHKLLGPRRDFPEKLEPFECGERQIVSPKQRFSVKFYLVAMLFVLFDLEAVFFYPWGALFRELGMYGFVVMSVFTVPLVIGLLYEWRKGALEW